MQPRGSGVRKFVAELLGVIGRGKPIRGDTCADNDEQQKARDLFGSLHASCALRPCPAISETVLASNVIIVTTNVSVTKSDRSRPSAACNASCPMPGMLH